MPSSLMTAWCALYNSPLIAFVIGCAVMAFFVLLALEAGGPNTVMFHSWPMRVLVGCCGLVSVTTLLASVFNIRVAC